jgi:hypothetical protein
MQTGRLPAAPPCRLWEDFIAEVARIMEYAAAYEICHGDVAYDQGPA